jgi:protein-S-isoprenylcysteine O-methyltransferase Ste14
MPTPGIVLITSVSIFIFFGLAAWGWGSVSGLLAHPARAGAFLVMIAANVAACFSGMSLAGFSRPGARRRWILIPVTLLSLLLAWLPAYCDRHDIWTLDGDAVRYLGLALLTIGCVFRVGPMFALGSRFTWPLANQEHHELVTTGFYRYIRHPSYLGAILGMIGWVLVFRSSIGLLLILFFLLFFHGVVRDEESLLMTEFGNDYAEYQRRTWRFLPYVW